MNAPRIPRIRGLEVTETEFVPTQPADYTIDGRDDNERKLRAAVGGLHRAMGALHDTRMDRVERAGHRVLPWVLAACAVAVFLILAFEPDCEPVHSAADCAVRASAMKGAR